MQATRLEAAGAPWARPGAVARVRDLFGMMSDGFLLRRGGGVSAGESRWSEKCTRREAAEWHRAVKKSVREAWEAAGECGARSKVVERAHIDLGLQAPELRVEIHLLASQHSRARIVRIKARGRASGVRRVARASGVRTAAAHPQPVGKAARRARPHRRAPSRPHDGRSRALRRRRCS